MWFGENRLIYDLLCFGPERVNPIRAPYAALYHPQLVQVVAQTANPPLNASKKDTLVGRRGSRDGLAAHPKT